MRIIATAQNSCILELCILVKLMIGKTICGLDSGLGVNSSVPEPDINFREAIHSTA